MKISIACILILFALSCFDANSEEGISLVQNGIAEYRIMLGNNASLTETFAAQELQGYIMQASGAFLPMANPDEPPNGNLIFIGENAIRKLGLSIENLELGEDGFIIKSVEKKIIIAGKNDRGTLYGVYAFLERLGYRWIAPGINGEVIPILPDIIVSSLNISERPAYNYRGFACLFPKTYKSIEWIDWIAKNRLNCIIIDSGVYDELNNELGEEIKKHGIQIGIRLDANELAKGEQGEIPTAQLSKKIGQFIDRYPNINLIELYSKDDNIAQLAEIADAINNSGKRIFIKIDGDSKLNIIKTKHNFSFDSTLRCYRHSIGDKQCSINEKQRSALKSLMKLSDKIFLYEHCMASYEQNSLPFPILQTISEDMPYLNTLKSIDGVITQCELGNWGTYGLNYYTFTRFSWNTRYNLGNVVDDYCNRYFGSASEPMKAFFYLLEDSMTKMDHISYIDPPELILRFFDEATIKKLNSEIDKAGKIANDVVVFDRIRKLDLSMKYTELLWNTLSYYFIGNDYQNEGNKGKTKENLKKSLEKGEELIKFLYQNSDEDVFIITESFIFDYIEPIINDIRDRLDSL